MKPLASLLFVIVCFVTVPLFSQTDSFEVYLEMGKQEFNREYDQQDYAVAVASLERAVELRPSHAEARYFLAYAYSRLNSSDGKNIISSRKGLTIKASEQLEEVISLSPKYTGEMLILDPYSKISSEWGSLALRYLYKNQTDSATWAFREGKKRGGFPDFILSINRETLKTCPQNAILMSSGDNTSFSLHYLQTVEGFRNDVLVIDISLLNTIWYPRLLSVRNNLEFNQPMEVIDTLQYLEWKDSIVKVNNFSWTLKPSYNNYLLRGDLLFLSLLQRNEFKRDVVFTMGFSEEDKLSLNPHLTLWPLTERVDFDNNVTSHKEYEAELKNVLKLAKEININSTDQLRMLDMVRWRSLIKVEELLEEGAVKQAKRLMRFIEKNANAQDYPYQFASIQLYVSYLKNRM